MRLVLVLGFIFLLNGCASMNLNPPNRWVDNNTFYSDKLPRLEIKVDESLPFLKKEGADKLATSTSGSMHAAKKTFQYYFKGDAKRLKIRISSLPESTNMYMIPPDYSKYKGNITSGYKELNGMRFATGVMADQVKGEPFLYKAYGKVVGGTTRYHIYYAENLASEWENYDPNLFSRADQDFLSAFNKRADKSFTISDYSPQKQSSTQQKQPDSENTQRLAKLESLYLDGILTKKEYEEKRTKIIDGMLEN